MKILLIILLAPWLTECNNSGTATNSKQIDKAQPLTIFDSVDIIKRNEKSDLRKITVIVFPPYDMIANEGISPNVKEYIEAEIIRDTNLTLLKFPYKQLINVPYQNLYDKKYCKPILDKIKADIFIMCKLDQVTHTGQMTLDKWNLRIKIYNTKTDNQITSKFIVDSLTDQGIRKALSFRQASLTNEIKNNR